MICEKCIHYCIHYNEGITICPETGYTIIGPEMPTRIIIACPKFERK